MGKKGSGNNGKIKVAFRSLCDHSSDQEQLRTILLVLQNESQIMYFGKKYFFVLDLLKK